ncbi:MAG: porin [Alloprevotella sp.]
MKLKLLLLLPLLPGLTAFAQQAAPAKASLPDWLPSVSGVVRAKAEWQTGEGEARFEVRNARIALNGQLLPALSYKAEIDLSDEGNIKMLDAFGEVRPFAFHDAKSTVPLRLRIGQFRVPFSIDAHRSPYEQYFANRSFIAKQVGDVRDVGLMAAWRFGTAAPLTLQAGAFNGSGLTNQKNYWTKSFNFSAKAEWVLPFGLTLEASVQKVSPTGGSVYLYDGGFNFRRGRWTLEAEYLRKHYTSADFKDVNAFDAFAAFDIPLRKTLQKISLRGRYDAMSDHSSGSLNEQGRLQVDDVARQRLTLGPTLCFDTGHKKTAAELRLNYEKYFYDDISRAKASERDKLVLELMVHF